MGTVDDTTFGNGATGVASAAAVVISTEIVVGSAQMSTLGAPVYHSLTVPGICYHLVSSMESWGWNQHPLGLG